MGLWHLVLILIVIGVVMTLLNKYGGEFIGQPWMKLINIVVIVAVILWLLFLFFGPLPDIPIGRR